MPTGTISGNVRYVSTIKESFALGAGVLSLYAIPVQPDDIHTYAAGTGANQANKVAVTSGTTVISTPVTIDLSSLACVDASTGFSHIREAVVYNDDLTHDLLVDLTVSNSFVGKVAGTSVKLTVSPGGFEVLVSKPLGTNGYVVDGTHKLVTIDPGAFAIAYRFFALGD